MGKEYLKGRYSAAGSNDLLQVVALKLLIQILLFHLLFHKFFFQSPKYSIYITYTINQTTPEVLHSMFK